MTRYSIFILVGLVLAFQAGGMIASASDPQTIMGKYENQLPTGKLHAANQGRIVWSDQEIVMAQQDRIKLRDSFRLTDPIFGRVFLRQSLGNTPVYNSRGDVTDNYEFWYEYRVFIDGTERAAEFGVFKQGRLHGNAGESWTTWQFAPHPVPSDPAFYGEAEAWQKVTKGLAPGNHKVRFELWGTQGQYRTKGPIAVGEFTLAVNAGDAVAAAGTFPGDTHGGGDTQAVRAAMLKAIVGPVAKSAGEVLKVSVTSDWKQGMYSDTKRRYRKVSGAVLWRDDDGDGVCRFTTYNFISDQAGGGQWGPLRFKSFCNGCPEGDAPCSK